MIKKYQDWSFRLKKFKFNDFKYMTQIRKYTLIDRAENMLTVSPADKGKSLKKKKFAMGKTLNCISGALVLHIWGV